MGVEIRPYHPVADYERVSRFLIDSFEPTDQLQNWMQPRWEYMHHHPFIADVPLDLIAVFEDEGQIVGLAHPEDKLTFVYFQRAAGYDHILPAMFAYADECFGGHSITLNRNIIGLFISDFDEVLTGLARAHGYELLPGFHEGYSSLDLTQQLPPVSVPDGFCVQSLAVENDHRKINVCLWRGFNHEGEIPEQELSLPAVAQDAPNFREDHTIVAVAPNGDFVSYAGIWHVPENGLAYIEPVATDPDYRRMGLGTACVIETLRLVQAAGARVAWVGSDQEFYASIGFTKRFQRDLWVKRRD